MINKRTIILPIALIVWLVQPARAQSFSYPNFSGATGLSLNGAATIAGTSLQLTPAVSGLAASAWYSLPQPVLGAFDTMFTIRITPVGSGADGMTFALHADPLGTAAIGQTGGALGYQGLATLFRSLVVEFDVYANGDLGDTAGNMISIHSNGGGPTGAHEAQSLARVSAPSLMANGQPHQVRITYVPGTLSVYFDNPATPLLTATYDLVTGGTFASSGIPVGGLGLPGGLAYVGFTAGNGGLYETHAVESWTWLSSGSMPLALAITQPSGPGSVASTITNGLPGSPYYTALSTHPLNATAPGQGWWGGLHIAFTDILAQVSLGAPPFVGALDATGTAFYSIPSGLPGSLPPIYAVTRTFSFDLVTVTGTSNLVTVTLL